MADNENAAVDGKPGAWWREGMTYQEFRKLYPATRMFQPYDSDSRATRSASHRLTRQQKLSVGEHFYIHELTGNVAFPTAKAATMAAYAIFLKNERTVP